ncbi:MAG: type II toxin-antitoxin system RelE/ParE family toxin [Fimbriiglobus sp.]
MKPAEIHREAEAEFLEALGYYDNQKPGLALVFRSAFESAVQTVRENPTMYAVEVEPDIRFCPLRKFPYNLVYMNLDRRVYILAVSHNKRRPGYWMHRIRTP